MYISNLTLHGFKSFAKKDKLKFGEGITAIVGPNGCGKTNIVDAIRWVLGEQKTSVLRGTTMQDIIFNGTEKQKPLGVCEVSLTVHNNKGKLPLEYNDVEISRRVFRNGESEYYINRNKCRRKDIYDLFVDTGMGSDAYSVIELKMIEQILSDTADDRKRMFEEAAGINKYKGQRKDALRKFEQTRVDLDRVEDIITEVDTKVRSLDLQLKRYKRHEKLTEQMKESDIALAFLSIKSAEKNAGPLRMKISEFKHLKESKATEESIHDTELTSLESGYRDQQTEVESLRERLNELDSEREEIANTILVAKEQSRASEAAIQRLDVEKDSGVSRAAQMKIQIAEYNEEIVSIDPVVNEKLSHYKKEKDALESVEKDYQNSRADLDRILTKRWESDRAVSEKESLLERTRALIEDQKKQVEILESKQVELDASRKEDESSKELLEKEKSETDANILELKTKLKDLEKESASLQEKRHTLTLEYHSTLAKAEGLESQLQFYKELVSRGEGYPEGTQYVLEHAGEFKDVIGTVADLITVETEKKSIIETALGDLASCLVSKDRTSALTIMEKMKLDDLGETSIIPLKEIAAIKTPLHAVPTSKNVLGRAGDFVSCKKEFLPLVDHLLGNLLVVSNLDNALKDSSISGWNLVDISGSFSGVHYLLKNKTRSNESSLLGRKKQIDTLNKEIESLVSKGQKQRGELTDLDGSKAEADAKIEALSGEIQGLIDELSDTETELIRSHFRQTQSLDILGDVSSKITTAKTSITDMEKSVDNLIPDIQDFRTKLTNMEKQVSIFEGKVSEAQAKRDGFHQRVQDMRIELLNLENSRDNLMFQKKTTSELMDELANRRKSIETEITGLTEKIKVLEAKGEAGEADLQKAMGKIRKQRSILDLKRTATDEAYRQIEEIRSKIRAEQRSRETILEELKQAEVDIAEFEQKIISQKERITEKYNLDIPDKIDTDESIDDIRLKIDRFQKSIENIGPINMAVKDEYDEESKRYDMLTHQKLDLIKAEENLRETIRKIDEVARKQFRETFDQIKTNFEKLFTMFFEGGKGQLELTGDPDPLEANISIHAQPPGKRNQSLRMLSAGEKALTAIALLFSIYQVKPSPYCILDAVDAPLDDVNIRKFTRVLQKFADETQFIVVTHNKLTMESANYLYGVTMEKRGVSKLVSVKFEA